MSVFQAEGDTVQVHDTCSFCLGMNQCRQVVSQVKTVHDLVLVVVEERQGRNLPRASAPRRELLYRDSVASGASGLGTWTTSADRDVQPASSENIMYCQNQGYHNEFNTRSATSTHGQVHDLHSDTPDPVHSTLQSVTERRRPDTDTLSPLHQIHPTYQSVFSMQQQPSTERQPPRALVDTSRSMQLVADAANRVSATCLLSSVCEAPGAIVFPLMFPRRQKHSNIRVTGALTSILVNMNTRPCTLEDRSGCL